MRIVLIVLVIMMVAGGAFLGGMFFNEKMSGGKKSCTAAVTATPMTSTTKTAGTTASQTAASTSAEGISGVSVKANQKVKSPLVITGNAVGTWYSEGAIPVVLYDANGEEIVRGNAEAQGEWMTNALVPFKISLEFDQPVTSTGKIVIKSEDLSGQSTSTKKIEIPVTFY